MRKHRLFLFALLLVLIANLMLATHALAETANSESGNGSDCGCSESGSSTSVDEESGRGTGYKTSDGSAAENAVQEDQPYRNESQNSVNLIWINLVSLGVVIAIVVMLVRYRKSVKMEQENKKK